MIITIPPLEERCVICKKEKYSLLCDFVIGYFRATTGVEMENLTCDAKMCEKCAVNISDNFDFCPEHAKKVKVKLKKF